MGSFCGAELQQQHPATADLEATEEAVREHLQGLAEDLHRSLSLWYGERSGPRRPPSPHSSLHTCASPPETPACRRSPPPRMLPEWVRVRPAVVPTRLMIGRVQEQLRLRSRVRMRALPTSPRGSGERRAPPRRLPPKRARLGDVSDVRRHVAKFLPPQSVWCLARTSRRWRQTAADAAGGAILRVLADWPNPIGVRAAALRRLRDLAPAVPSELDTLGALVAAPGPAHASLVLQDACCLCAWERPCAPVRECGDWVELLDEEGRAYIHNRAKGTTQWHVTGTPFAQTSNVSLDDRLAPDQWQLVRLRRRLHPWRCCGDSPDSFVVGRVWSVEVEELQQGEEPLSADERRTRKRQVGIHCLFGPHFSELEVDLTPAEVDILDLHSEFACAVLRYDPSAYRLSVVDTTPYWWGVDDDAWVQLLAVAYGDSSDMRLRDDRFILRANDSETCASRNLQGFSHLTLTRVGAPGHLRFQRGPNDLIVAVFVPVNYFRPRADGDLERVLEEHLGACLRQAPRRVGLGSTAGSPCSETGALPEADDSG
eukprot:TRINITY_DN4610_c0_g1_i1.p1 TRINITY_DN4610_c0_g1~~TRINITY_DN4610_c0_g1_i1.p1  ORF type:complete len:561 (+),score=127.90 TRINITY_DN4610_c0_g1_i1:61-1683(+)